MKKKFFINILNTVRENKILFKVVSKLIDIYSVTAAAIENKLLKKNISDNSFNKLGFTKLETHANLKTKLEKIKKLYENPNFSAKNALNNKEIQLFLENLFTSEFRNEITNLTGFAYSIDYFRILRNRSTKKYGAAHFDKSFSKNMIKIFIPINTTNESGPLKLFNKIDSKSIKNGTESAKFKDFSLVGDGEYIYVVRPNECFHYETVPNENFSSINIMMQLNPSVRWGYRTNLSKMQFYFEPKFTSFNYFIRKIPLK